MKHFRGEGVNDNCGILIKFLVIFLAESRCLFVIKKRKKKKHFAIGFFSSRMFSRKAAVRKMIKCRLTYVGEQTR